MIYDIFSFNNEIDMLELRLNILDPYVDKFVLVEADKTFSGSDKPFHYEKNSSRFKEFHHKILHHKITDSPKSFEDKSCDQMLINMALNSDNVTREHICWLIEFYQKEHITHALKKLSDDDICIVSDIDEIWNYDYIDDIKSINYEDVYKPKIDNCYIEYLNVRTNENWTFFTGPIVCRYKKIRENCLNHLRTQRKMNNHYIFWENGGWHFNALGGSDKKIEDFQHPVYHKDYMNLRKHGSRLDESGLPDYILKNKEDLKKRKLMI